MSIRVKARTVFLLACLLVACASVGLAALAATSSTGTNGGEGSWEPSNVNDCPGGMICVEYVTSLGTEEPCCVSPEKVGTSLYSACNSYFRHLH